MKEVRILIGIPASGKSTFAKNFVFSHKDYKIVSTDDIRWKLFGNPSIQGNPKRIFAIAYKEIISYLNSGHNVIFDATNISRNNRANLINFLLSILYSRPQPTEVLMGVLGIEPRVRKSSLD